MLQRDNGSVVLPPGTLSPELALVDERLAQRARDN